jgi:DNA-binding transcriptional LysR family regulator
MFEISQLRCFIAVAEELHFSRAAERLNMTQPPLSRQVQLLEHNVGVQLLDRSSRVVRLTAAGKAFLPEALRIIRLADEASLLARRVAKGQQGSLAIGFTSASGYTLLPEVVRRLRERTPELALTLKELVSTAQVEELDAGQLDMALMRPMALHGELVSLPIAKEGMLLAIPEREADTWPDAPTLADLHRRPFIMYSPHEARPFYQMLTSRFEREGVVPDVVEHIGQVHTMLALVSAGIGAAMVSEACARLQFDGVVLRRIKTEPVSTVCAYRRNNENPILQLFIRDILPTFPGAS